MLLSKYPENKKGEKYENRTINSLPFIKGPVISANTKIAKEKGLPSLIDPANINDFLAIVLISGQKPTFFRKLLYIIIFFFRN